MQQLTMETLFRQSSEESLGLEPVHVYIQRKPRPRRGKRLESPCPKAICPHPEGDVFVLEDKDGRLCYIPVNVTRSSTVHYADKRSFLKAVQREQESRRLQQQNTDIRQGRVDDLVTVDLMIRESGLTQSESDDLITYFLAHPDIKWEHRESAKRGTPGDRFHFIRATSWKVAERIVGNCPHLNVAGLSLNAPDSMYSWLAPGIAMARRTYPTIATAMQIDNGKTLSLKDCFAYAIELPEDWSGKVWVTEVKTVNGETLFEVNADRQKVALNEWLCDFPSVESAADMAALLEASYDQLVDDVRAGKFADVPA